MHLHRRQNRENLFAAIPHKLGDMPLATIEMCAAVTSAVAVEQLLQQDAAHLMHGCTDRHFAGFQVQVPQSLAILQDAPHETVYFSFRFSAKCLRSFFFNCSKSFSFSMLRTGRN